MNKKLFFLVLPTLMALSACAGVPHQKANVLLEDTLAHEEIFGDAQAFEPIKINTPYRADGDSSEPAAAPLKVSSVGVQYKPVAAGYCAIRYVAAISDLNVTATWTRNICESSGNRRKTDNSQVPCTVAYSALSESGGVAVPSSLGSEYKAFVVYTLRNIPESDVNSYLFGYLTVSNASEIVKTDARVSRVGGGDTFTFDTTTKSGYFLHGNIGGQEYVAVNDNGGTDNWIQEEGIPMNAEDEFGLFKYEPGNDEHFQHFGNYGSNSFNYMRTNNNGKQKAFHNGSYNIYLSKNKDTMNVVYFSGTVSAERIYLDAVHWDPNGCRLSAYLFKEWTDEGGNHKNETWVNMSATDDGNVYKIDVDTSLYNTVIFCRMDKSKDNGWNSEGDKRVYNQSYDLGLPGTNAIARKYYITGWEDSGGKCPGKWHSVDA